MSFCVYVAEDCSRQIRLGIRVTYACVDKEQQGHISCGAEAKPEY